MLATSESNFSSSPIHKFTAMASTMRAWQYDTATGGLEKNLKLNNAALAPSKNGLGKHQVLVEVISASVNPVDLVSEMGIISKAIISTPASPAIDFCGRVVALHPTNDTLHVGQKVFGKLDTPTKFGTFAQFTIAPTSGCVALPEDVDEDQAAACGLAALTAYQRIEPHVKVGSKVFINGGSGGTGTYGIQIAKILGCEVTTTCSTGNVALVKELGADEVIDYTKVNLIEVLKSKGQVFDLVIDNVGVPTQLYEECPSFLKPGCFYVQVGSDHTLWGIVCLFGKMLRPRWLGGGKRPLQAGLIINKKEDFEQIGTWMAEGKIKSVIDQVFEWEDAPKAYEKLKTGRAKGKIVLHVTAKSNA
jgi:NADPH:quinone reductase-like Zn-dependent oxidoreductase